jgi:hypothetical protein
MKIPYQLVAAMSIEKRHEQMAHAIKQGFSRLKKTPITNDKVFSIACYGPSLADTWHTIKRPIISVSGALHYLADRGIIPDYHVDMDPRAHKVRHINPVVKGVHYLMASVCPPETWDVLRDEKVTIWHGISGDNTLDWVRANDPNEEVISGGSSVGLAAIQIGGMLGAQHFEIHGMDGSIRDGKRHAGPHFGHAQGGITWDAGCVTYQTSRIMSNACAEMVNMIRVFPIFCVFHGSGLQQALIRESGFENAACADEVEKAANVRRSYPIILERIAA